MLALPGMCTLHANSGREALVKMCTLPLLAGENVTSAFVVPTVAACIDLVVHLGLDPRGQRRVREIVAVSGRVEGEVIEAGEVFALRGDRLERADAFPPHQARYEAAGIDLPALLGGRRAGSTALADSVPAGSVPVGSAPAAFAAHALREA